MDKQAPELSEVKVHLVLLAAMHPELQIHGKAEQFIASIQTSNPALWKEAKNPNRDEQDGWDARIRMLPDEPAALQQEQD